VERLRRQLLAFLRDPLLRSALTLHATTEAITRSSHPDQAVLWLVTALQHALDDRTTSEERAQILMRSSAFELAHMIQAVAQRKNRRRILRLIRAIDGVLDRLLQIGLDPERSPEERVGALLVLGAATEAVYCLDLERAPEAVALLRRLAPHGPKLLKNALTCQDEDLRWSFFWMLENLALETLEIPNLVGQEFWDQVMQHASELLSVFLDAPEARGEQLAAARILSSTAIHHLPLPDSAQGLDLAQTLLQRASRLLECGLSGNNATARELALRLLTYALIPSEERPPLPEAVNAVRYITERLNQLVNIVLDADAAERLRAAATALIAASYSLAVLSDLEELQVVRQTFRQVLTTSDLQNVLRQLATGDVHIFLRQTARILLSIIQATQEEKN